MWSVHCPECGRRTVALLRVTELSPRVVAFEGRCPAGHDIVLVSGRTVAVLGRLRRIAAGQLRLWDRYLAGLYDDT